MIASGIKASLRGDFRGVGTTHAPTTAYHASQGRSWNVAGRENEKMAALKTKVGKFVAHINETGASEPYVETLRSFFTKNELEATRFHMHMKQK